MFVKALTEENAVSADILKLPTPTGLELDKPLKVNRIVFLQYGFETVWNPLDQSRFSVILETFIASYYRQFFMNIKLKIIKLKLVC